MALSGIPVSLFLCLSLRVDTWFPLFSSLSRSLYLHALFPDIARLRPRSVSDPISISMSIAVFVSLLSRSLFLYLSFSVLAFSLSPFLLRSLPFLVGRTLDISVYP